MECKVQRLIVDSSGFVEGSLAREYQYEVIDLIRPDIVVVLMKEGSVDPLFRNFMGTPQIEMLRLPVSRFAVSRTPAARKAYRRECFSRYLDNARSRELSFKHLGVHGKIPHPQSPEAWKNLLFGLCNHENFTVCLGIIEHIDIGSQNLRVLAPAFEPDEVCSLEIGGLYLSQAGEELPNPALR
jgi:polynucleotide 5'-kinase involved in rRNA processing